MKFMMIVKTNKDSEAGVMPNEELLAAVSGLNSSFHHIFPRRSH